MSATLRPIPNAGRAQQEWAEKISTSLLKSVEAIFETGRLLIEAKADLPHGSFEAMIENRLPFSIRTAQSLMSIAKNPQLAKAQHVACLPPAWGTLAELARLDPEELDTAFERNLIAPEMQRRDVAQIRARVREALGRQGPRRASRAAPKTVEPERVERNPSPTQRRSPRRAYPEKVDSIVFSFETLAPELAKLCEEGPVPNTEALAKQLEEVRRDLARAIRSLRARAGEPIPMRLCRSCETEKPEWEFSLGARCKSCKNAEQRRRSLKAKRKLQRRVTSCNRCGRDNVEASHHLGWCLDCYDAREGAA